MCLSRFPDEKEPFTRPHVIPNIPHLLSFVEHILLNITRFHAITMMLYVNFVIFETILTLYFGLVLTQNYQKTSNII